VYVQVADGQFIELFLKEDILVIDVSVNEVHPGRILGGFEGGTDDLEHGCNARASSNHTNLARQCRGIIELAFRTFNANLVANFEERNVSGDVAFLVRLGIMRARALGR